MHSHLPNGGWSCTTPPRNLARMSLTSMSRALVNPRPEAVRLLLSDGSERVVPPWGVAVVPRSSRDGQPIAVLQALLLERRVIPGTIELPPPA